MNKSKVSVFSVVPTHGEFLDKAQTMKIPVIFVVLVMIYCVAAGDAQKKTKPKENDEGDNPEGAGSPPSTTASPPRARRSPPRFDANQMKGKYAKSSKIKRSVVPYLDVENTNRLERSIGDYLSPTSTLLYAIQPPKQEKTLKTTSFA